MKKQIIVMFLLLTAVAGIGQVSLSHTLPAAASAGETIDAQFTVTKGNIGSFAKFQCDMPAGTQASAGDTKSGNFTYENNRLKIVWVSLPAESSFTFSFKITLTGSGSTQNFTSQFYYLENNVKKEFVVPMHSISVSGAMAGSGSGSTPTETTSGTGTGTPTETVVSTPTETTTAGTGTSTGGSTGTSGGTSTTPRSGLVYYVQVAALSADPGLMFKRYGKAKVVVENGLYKVLIGTYSTLEEARKHKAELISQGLIGSFVVAYENGVRVRI